MPNSAVDPNPSVPDLDAIVAALESSGPAAMAAFASPAPDESTYLAAFPALTAVTTNDVVIDGPDGGVPARIYRPLPKNHKAAVVWAHGGGFAGGDLDMPEAHWVGLALAAAGYGVLSVDYRKCTGGVHYPAPSDDVLAAWHWAAAHLEDLGAASGQLHLGGASAGGSLAAGVTKRLRDASDPMPASVVLVYPTLHPDVLALGDDDGHGQDPGLAQAGPILAWMNRNYAGSDAMLDNPYAFPGLGEVGGQPPHLIVTCENDLLRKSGETYAAALGTAGVSVDIDQEPDTGHGHLNDPLLPAAMHTIERIDRWLASHNNQDGR